jgi:hypothetical protein
LDASGWRGAHEACSATWNHVIISTSSLGKTKTTENFDRVDRSQGFPDANMPAFKCTLVPVRDITLFNKFPDMFRIYIYIR